MSYETLSECLCCGSKRLSNYLDLGAQPLANSYHDGRTRQDRFPLAVNRCEVCWHSQLSVAVEPDLLYRHYLYVSGTTQTLRDYFDWFVDWVEDRMGRRPLRVLDIACNDGTLLERFRLRGHDVLGVDPAENLAHLAREKGVRLETAYWNRQTAERIAERFDVIIAMNVLAHVSRPLEFLSACRGSLAEGGCIFVQTSQAEMLQRKEFDTVYHEHHSFFNTRSLQALSSRAGLDVTAARTVPVHGTSYLWTLTSGGEADASVSGMLSVEERHGCFDAGTYASFAQATAELAARTREALHDHRRRGFRVIGYGAAAKGNTFVNYAGLSLDCIVDDNPLKVGQLAPGCDIPIVPLDAVKDDAAPLLVLVLAWNFFDEVRTRLQRVRSFHSDRFLTYFPELVIV